MNNECHEILLVGELLANGSNYIGRKVRTIGTLVMISTFIGQLKWKNNTIVVDFEYVHMDHVKEGVCYHILGEIQENAVIFSLHFF